MVEFCLINIAYVVFFIKNNIKLSSIVLIIGFCFLVYDKNSDFKLNYKHIEKGIFDIIMLLLFIAVQVEIFRKETTPFQIAHSNVYNIFYLITVFIWCFQKYSFSYSLIFFLLSAFFIIYLSVIKVVKHFKKMKKNEKSDTIYLTTSIWIIYWLFEIGNIF